MSNDQSPGHSPGKPQRQNPVQPRLVLASASPRRSELLAGLGLDFELRPGEVDETPLAGELPGDYVLRLAHAKAAAVARPGELVLGADTTVVFDGDILGKPADAAEARAMLARIAGREHIVLSGVALHSTMHGGIAVAAGIESTRVCMAEMSPELIAWYVATGEPMDKAGSYAVQGIGSWFVDQVHGNHTNVVGLPLPLVRRLLAEIGTPIEALLAVAAPTP